jgi:hypothetical protein
MDTVQGIKTNCDAASPKTFRNERHVCADCEAADVTTVQEHVSDMSHADRQVPREQVATLNVALFISDKPRVLFVQPLTQV